ncbi:hypothetical protein [Cupriavidus oxalaticus]|uniref:hypothetical protein n=1 Tax=Cupriavidus oxalaticus TaxID=96344 RepID=UPI00316B8D9E
MVIAMIPMGVMQMIANQIIYMVAVRYGLMAAARAVLVVRVMAAALMVGGTPIRIGIADCKHVLIDVIAVHVMNVPVMQIVNVSLMTHGEVSAIGPVLVRVIDGVFQRAVSHGANSLIDFRVRNPVDTVAQAGKEKLSAGNLLVGS